MTDTELERALKMAIHLDCEDVREDVLDRIDELDLSSARKIQLARLHGIAKWYGPEILRLALRLEDWTAEEGKQIGWEIASLVSSLQRMHPWSKAKAMERIVNFCDIKAGIFREDELKSVLNEMGQSSDEAAEDNNGKSVPVDELFADQLSPSPSKKRRQD